MCAAPLQWPVWNWPFALWQWVKQMAIMYGFSIVPWLDWVSPTSVWDFIAPGVYTWAAIVRTVPYHPSASLVLSQSRQSC